MKHCAFDIETNGVDDPIVTCAATQLCYGDNENHTIVWHSNYSSAMQSRDLECLIEYLYALHLVKIPTITFNGLAFDFKVVHDNINEGSKARLLCRLLARNHIDIMYQFSCHHGYFASMQSFMLGMRHPGKSGNGKDAIDMWCGDSANLQTKKAVLDYCRTDVKCLSELTLHIAEHNMCARVSKSDHRSTWHLSDGLQVAHECHLHLCAHPPNTKWMKDPPDIKTMIRWTVSGTSPHPPASSTSNAKKQRVSTA